MYLENEINISFGCLYCPVTLDKTSLKVNSVLEREPNQLISTSVLSNKYLVCFGMINKTIKIRTNQFIFTKSEKI